MSRSRRSTPKAGLTGARSDKAHKRHLHKKLRGAAQAAIRRGREVTPTLRDVSDVWWSPKEGKLAAWGEDPRRDRRVRKVLKK